MASTNFVSRLAMPQLQVGDVRVDAARPHLWIRRGTAKGGRARTVSLKWDAGTLADIAGWKAARLARRAMLE